MLAIFAMNRTRTIEGPQRTASIVIGRLVLGPAVGEVVMLLL